MNSILSILKALGEKNRLRAFLKLTNTKELCVCEVGEFLGLSAATVSRHMSILCQANLVESQKRGKWVYYSINSMVAPELLQWIRNSVFAPSSIVEDGKESRASSGNIRTKTVEKHVYPKKRGEIT